MTLLSPGVKVTIVDESNYLPAATNSVPYFLIATASNKTSGTGIGVAPGTIPANANTIYQISSQRELAATFGNPLFYNTSDGTPINGYELNEYGLLAAHSALGITNQCYVQRVDIDLAELTASLVRPTGNPPAGTFWFDTNASLFGVFQWNIVTAGFTNEVPSVITNPAYVDVNNVPLQTYGTIGNYAVVAVDSMNPYYFKRGGPTALDTTSATLLQNYNTWVQVGSPEWQQGWPTISGTLAPTTLTAGDVIVINGTSIAVPASPLNTVVGLSDAINAAAISGVYSAHMNGMLQIYGDSTTEDQSILGIVSISNAPGSGNTLAVLGIAETIYNVPQFYSGPSYSIPRWRSTDSSPAPTGSIWMKTNKVNLGAHLSIQKFNSTLKTFISQPCNLYNNDASAIYALDPGQGGLGIAQGTTYAQITPMNDFTAGFEILEYWTSGPTVVTALAAPDAPFVVGSSFQIQATAPGQSTLNSGVAILTGTTPADFVAAVSSANVPFVSAAVSTSGAIVFTHSTGGDIVLQNVTGSPITIAGFIGDNIPLVRPNYVNGVQTGSILSNFINNNPMNSPFSYIASANAPTIDPPDGQLWYDSNPTAEDIMILDNGIWQGYQNVNNDARGYNLTRTNAAGPIYSPTPPTTQTDAAQSPLAYGDLWIDTSDLINYPVINRWTNVNNYGQWVQIANNDSTTINGVIFQDARWAPNGTTNPITDPIPSISQMLTSNYVDPDAPNPELYPDGILLFNTRLSGYNVKSFQVDYFNSTDYPAYAWSPGIAYTPGQLANDGGQIYICIAPYNENLQPSTNPTYWTLFTQTNTWTSASPNNEDGTPNFGSNAQRVIIVKALKSGVDSSTVIREEQQQFNLLACPQYPELIPNLVVLNDDRGDTGFIVGDTPLDLTPTNIVSWATNDNGTGTNPQNLLSYNDYVGVFYPSCLTNDLSGNQVVTAPSHMMVRTIIRSDSVSYPWLAPAGTRRGVVDNAIQIGYIDDRTGDFLPLGVDQALRDVLYQNQVNPITFIPGVGIVNFGNKTTSNVTTLMDRINVARLIAFMRGRLQIIGKQYLFEPNDQITRNQISNAITSLMIDLVAKRGIYDYLVICDNSNNTPATIDANELWVDIAIEPVTAVEFIYIPVRIMATGQIAALSSTSTGTGAVAGA